MELIIVLSDECSFSEDGVSLKNIIIPFLIKHEVFLQIASFIKVSFDYESHVTK